MTNEEAIIILKRHISEMMISLCDTDEHLEAEEIAIEALEKQIPKVSKVYEMETNLPTGEKAIYIGCPTCGAMLESWNFRHSICKCGQKLKDQEIGETDD